MLAACPVDASWQLIVAFELLYQFLDKRERVDNATERGSSSRPEWSCLGALAIGPVREEVCDQKVQFLQREERAR